MQNTPLHPEASTLLIYYLHPVYFKQITCAFIYRENKKTYLVVWILDFFP
jgi:hypothetical protein